MCVALLRVSCCFRRFWEFYFVAGGVHTLRAVGATTVTVDTSEQVMAVAEGATLAATPIWSVKKDVDKEIEVDAVDRYVTLSFLL